MRIIDVALTLQNVTDLGKSTTHNIMIGDSGTATATLHISGSGNDSTTTSFLIENSNGTDIFSVYDSGIIHPIYTSSVATDGSTIVISNSDVASTLSTASVVIGFGATSGSTLDPTGSHTVVGYYAGSKMDGDDGDKYLVAVGYRAGEGSSNETSTYVGAFAGSGSEANGIGKNYDRNSFLGAYSGQEYIGSDSTLIGSSAGYQAFGDENTYLGVQAGAQWGAANTSENSNQNVIIGYGAGYSETNSDTTASNQNVIIGYETVHNNPIGSGNTIIGSKLVQDGNTIYNNTVLIGSDDKERLQIDDTGVYFFDYGVGNRDTGIVAYGLGVTSTGLIIETPAPSTTPVDGVGEANKVAFWTDTDTISKDTELHFDSTNDRLGIKMTSPVSTLHIGDGNDTIDSDLYSSDIVNVSAQSTAPGVNIISAGNSSFNRGVFKATRAKGTLATPTAVSSDNYVFSLLGAGYDGTNAIASAGIEMLVDGTVSTGNVPQRIEFQTGTSGRNTHMQIKSTGQIILDDYGQNSFAGIAAKYLAVNTFGHIVEVDAGTLDGTGTVNYIPKWSATDTLTDSVMIESSNNIGIGVTTPAKKLHVYNSTNEAQVRLSQDSVGSYDIGVYTDDVFSIGRDADTQEFNIKNGNVGIGTTDPIDKLEVLTELSDVDVIDYPFVISSQDPGDGLNQTIGAGVGLKFRIAGNDATNPGNSIVGASIAAIREDADDTNSSTGLGFFISQADETLDEAVRISHDGNMGIGITTPTEKLQVEGNVIISGSLITYQENTDVDSAAAETIATVVLANYKCAFFDYVIENGTNLRAGTVTAVHDGTNVEYVETSTNDLGDTSDVTLSVDISGTDLRLRATVLSDDWSIKTLTRTL